MTRSLRKLLPFLTIAVPLLTLIPHPVLAFGESFMWSVVVNTFGWLAAAMGLLLDYSLNEFVIGFGSYFQGSSSLGATIDKLWVTVRDIFNLTFIFGLVYIGFKMILGSDDSNTKRWLVHLILAALLVNFSLFFTKTIIEVSNVLATQIAVSGFPDDGDGDVSISYGFMEAVGMQSIFNNKLPGDGEGEGMWAYIFGSMMLFMVAAFVFAAGAFLLIIRFAVLLLYLMLSPVMFIGWVFPQLQKYTNQYWSGFLNRAFFAPIYILLVFLSLSVITSFYDHKKSKNIPTDLQAGMSAGGVEGKNAIEGSFPPFILSSILMLAAVIVASKMSGDAGKATMSAGRNLANRTRRATGAMTVGAAGAVGRNTVGRLAQAGTNNERFRNLAARNTLARNAMKVTQKVAGASFDARNVAGVGGALGIGTGKKGGYTKKVQDKVAADEKFVKSIATNADLNDPKVKAKIAVQEKKIKKEKLAQAESEKVKAATIQADKHKDSVTLNNEIKSLGETIADEIKKLKTEESKGNLTPEQIEKKRAEITTKQSELSAKNSIKDMVKKREKSDTTEAEKESINAQLDALPEVHENQAKALENQAANDEGIRRSAQASVQFENEIAFMQSLEREENMFRSLVPRVAGGTGGALSGAMLTGGAGLLGLSAGVLGGAGVGALAATGIADRNKASRENLERLYGANGERGADTKAQEKFLANLKKQMDEDNAKNQTTSGTTPPPTPPPTPPTPPPTNPA